eukprot:15695-Heterococcus_DN1.PRE.1
MRHSRKGIVTSFVCAFLRALTRVAATAAAGRVRNGLWLLSIEDRLSFSLAKGVFSGLRIGVRAGKPELRILPGVFASLASIGAGMCEPRDPLPPGGMLALSELTE